MNNEDLQVKEIYAIYGLAMYQAQCCERELAILMSSAWASQPDRMIRSDYEKLLHSNFNKTFGFLVKVLEKKPEIDQHLIEDIRKAINLRNLLAHSYFWERAGEFILSKGRIKMITELNGYIAFFEGLDSRLTVLSISWANNHGVTDAIRQAEMNKIINNAIKNMQ